MLRKCVFFLILVLLLLTTGSAKPFDITTSFTEDDPYLVQGYMNPHKFPGLDSWECVPGVGYEDCMYDMCRMEKQILGKPWISTCGIDFREVGNKDVWRAAFREHRNITNPLK